MFPFFNSRRNETEPNKDNQESKPASRPSTDETPGFPSPSLVNAVFNTGSPSTGFAPFISSGNEPHPKRKPSPLQQVSDDTNNEGDKESASSNAKPNYSTPSHKS